MVPLAETNCRPLGALVNVEGSVSTHIDSTLQSLASDFQRMMAALDVPPDGRGGSGAAANAANSLMSV